MPIDVDRAIAAPGSDIVNTNLRRDVLAMLGARATVGLVNVAIIALVAQALGPAGQGRVAVGLAVTLLAVQLGTFGLTAATTVWIARDPSAIPDVLGIVRWWALGIGISAGLALAVFTISTDTLSLTSGDALAIALATPFLMAATLQQGALLGLGRARPMNAAEAGAGLFALGSVALTVFAFDGGATAALGAALLQFPVAALGYSFLLRDHRPLRKRPNRTTAAAMLRFARKPFAAAALTFFVVRSDLILIDGFLGPADAGLYAAAVTTSQAVYLVPLVIGINLLPRAARTGTAALTSRLLRRLIVPYGVLCLGLGALAAPVISVVFGDEYPTLGRAPALVDAGHVRLWARGRDLVSLRGDGVSEAGNSDVGPGPRGQCHRQRHASALVRSRGCGGHLKRDLHGRARRTCGDLLAWVRG